MLETAKMPLETHASMLARGGSFSPLLAGEVAEFRNKYSALARVLAFVGHLAGVLAFLALAFAVIIWRATA